MKKIEFFKVEGNRINRIRKHCPKCGPAVFLAEHKNRFSCGKCGYTEFKSGGMKESSPPQAEELKSTKKPVQDQEKPDTVSKPPVEEPTEEIPAPSPDLPTDGPSVEEQPTDEPPQVDEPVTEPKQEEETTEPEPPSEEEKSEEPKKEDKESDSKETN